LTKELQERQHISRRSGVGHRVEVAVGPEALAQPRQVQLTLPLTLVDSAFGDALQIEIKN
jgi:hypothetical protein